MKPFIRCLFWKTALISCYCFLLSTMDSSGENNKDGQSPSIIFDFELHKSFRFHLELNQQVSAEEQIRNAFLSNNLSMNSCLTVDGIVHKHMFDYYKERSSEPNLPCEDKKGILKHA